MCTNRYSNSPNYVKLGFFFLLPFLCLLLSSASAYADSQKSISVEVTGEGQTAYGAQQEAVRRAMQMVFTQIVIVDRKIENEQIVMDRVISSMNGYVEKFKVLKETSSGGVYAIKADVTISVQPILNFLRANNINSASVSGKSVMAEVSREQENKNFRTKFVERLFLGYPYRAMDIRSTRVAPSMKKPGFIEIDIEYSLNSKFIENLRTGFKSIQCRDSECEFDFAMICFENNDCIKIPPGLDVDNGMFVRNGGYLVLQDAAGDLYMSALFLDKNDIRVDGEVNKCADGLWSISYSPLIIKKYPDGFEGAIDYNSNDNSLMVKSRVFKSTVFINLENVNANRFSKVEKILFLPLILRNVGPGQHWDDRLYFYLEAAMHYKKARSSSPYQFLTPSNFRIDGCYQ